MKTLAMTALLLFVSAAGFAQAKEGEQQKDTSTLVATTTIRIETIQCGSCVRTVEKALKAVDGVENVQVDRDKKIATVIYEPSSTSVEELELAVTKSGYAANDKKADPQAYEKLDECCKISEE